MNQFVPKESWSPIVSWSYILSLLLVLSALSIHMAPIFSQGENPAVYGGRESDTC